jgi:hypothetical protein
VGDLPVVQRSEWHVASFGVVDGHQVDCGADRAARARRDASRSMVATLAQPAERALRAKIILASDQRAEVA